MGVNGAVGIHGTGQPWSIGTRASHGCIRMTVPDVIDLFGRVDVGTPVLIAYDARDVSAPTAADGARTAAAPRRRARSGASRIASSTRTSRRPHSAGGRSTADSPRFAPRRRAEVARRA